VASVTLKESGCLGVLVLVVVWVVLFFASIFTETEWLVTATSLSIPAIPLGYFVGEFLGGRH
jgi:hypothetical protein